MNIFDQLFEMIFLANLVKYYPKTGRKYVISYGNWRYADIPLNDILRAQRKRKLDDDLDGDDSAAKRQKMDISTTGSMWNKQKKE